MSFVISLIGAVVLSRLIFALITVLLPCRMKIRLAFSGNKLRIIAENGASPLWTSKLRLRVRKTDSGQSAEIRICGIRSGTSRSVMLENAGNGTLTAEIISARAGFVSCFIGKKIALPSAAVRLAYDRTVESEKQASSSEIALPDGAREYRRGDRLSDVHMKLSAKCGKYMTKERFGIPENEGRTPDADESPVSLKTIKETPPPTAAELLRAEMANAAFLISVFALFGVGSRAVFAVIYSAVFIALAYLAERNRGLFAIPITAALLPAAISVTRLSSQLARMWNAAAYSAFERFGTIPQLAETKAPSVGAACFFAAAAAWSIWKAARSKDLPIKLLASAAILLPHAVFADKSFPLCMSAASVLLLFCDTDKRGISASIVRMGASLICLAALLLADLHFAMPSNESGYIPPKGDIANANAFITDGTSALEVVMDIPEPMYLHGFIGYEYQNGAWSGPDLYDLKDEASTFYYLDSRGFSASTQTVRLLEYGGYEKNNVTVRNLAADSQYLYSAIWTENTLSRYAADLETPAPPFNSGIYSFTAPSDITKLSEELSERYRALPSTEYIDDTAIMDGIAKQTALGLTDETKHILSAQLDGYECNEGDISEAVRVIYDYLGDFEYNAAVSGISAEAFLQKTKSGYSPHFASAAVMIFRYYGIPARYAEGYAVTYDDVDGKAANSAIALNDGSFHAWAEYYLDGAGWIPFEATPEYFGKMPMPSGVGYSGNNSPSHTVGEPQTSVESSPEAVSGERLSKEISDKSSRSKRSDLILCAVIAAVLSAVLLQIIKIRRISRDLTYALYSCVRLLKHSAEIPLLTSGSYDFSAIRDKTLKEKLEKLQKICLAEFYSDKPFSREKNSESIEVYRACRRYYLWRKAH